MALHRGGGLCSDQSEICLLLLPRGQVLAEMSLGFGPMADPGVLRGAQSNGRGDANGGDSQSRERGKPVLLLGATTHVALGKALPLFLRPGRGWVGPRCRAGSHRSLPAQKQKTGLFLEGCGLGRGRGSPYPCMGPGGPGNVGVSPLRPRPPWLVVVGGWSRRGEMEPRAGGAHSPKK